ncbi:hypothetical protein MIND_00109800 [Mycena indigotica]|uniref:Zn(2)-C6 fungal-type domain-containing protein n=1 Tax=Mycena indigotica TaxID=2126181 RepID=A0A8H6TEE0_9AGAR|nr:uncharacterized protein MIND_00109800 [Mycena indigotica]KAF7315930.1 hypothetical protein MIND_00109800 [Mycena indigotica]
MDLNSHFDQLFYKAFPDAVPKSSDERILQDHIRAYAPPEAAQPLLAFSRGEFAYPDPSSSWYLPPVGPSSSSEPPPTQQQPRQQQPPLSLDLPLRYTHRPDLEFSPISATNTPVTPYWNDLPSTPPSSANSTVSPASAFPESPPAHGTVFGVEGEEGPAISKSLPAASTSRRDEGSSKRGTAKRRNTDPYDRRKRERSKDKDKDKKPTVACYFCRQRKIACGPPITGLGMSMDACNQCQRRSLKCAYPSESRRGKRPQTEAVTEATTSASPEAAEKDKGELSAKDEEDLVLRMDDDMEKEDSLDFEIDSHPHLLSIMDPLSPLLIYSILSPFSFCPG